jgi:uncharacterized protein (DUF849 family)
MADEQSKDEAAKTILAVAPSGARRGKSDHPGIPLTAEELAIEAPLWRESGASVIHLHVRDEEGGHTLSPAVYGHTIQRLRDAVGEGMVIQITTESAGRFTPEQQMETVRAVRPEAASLALRELAPAGGDQRTLADFLAWTAAEGIAGQLILYDRLETGRLLQWINDGDIDPAAISVLFVLGRFAANQIANPVDLLGFLGVEELPFRDWMVCAFGPNELRCAALSALLGGHVRVGFENNFHLPGGKLAARNADLVAVTARTLGALNMELATAADVRSIWRIG